MQMLREHDKCVDRKEMALPRYGDSLTQGRDMIDEQGFSPFQQVDRKEPTPARNERAAIIRHEIQNSTC
jgi:hypothetical protein